MARAHGPDARKPHKTMKYETIVLKNKDGSIYEANLVRDTSGFCCPEMQDAIKKGFIGFGEYASIINQNPFFSIYKCSAYPEGACWEDMPIKFCPFCGEEIVSTVIEEIRD